MGSGSVVNEVQNDYNDFAQPTDQYQAHSGAVDINSTPKVQYAFADGSANHIRPTSITYPDGRVISLDYGTAGGMDDILSRPQAIKDGALELAKYTWLGQAAVVQVDYTEPDVRHDLITGSGDDPYDGLDRFGRITDNLWRDYGASGQYSASPILANGHLYLASEPGQITVVEAGDELEVVHQVRLNDFIYVSPALDADTLYVRSAKSLWAFRRKKN